MNQNPLELVKNQEIFENMIDYNIPLDDNSDRCPLCNSDSLLIEGRCVTCLECRMEQVFYMIPIFYILLKDKNIKFSKFENTVAYIILLIFFIVIPIYIFFFVK